MTDSDAFCAGFIAYAHPYFAEIFEKHGFTLGECLCQHDGRECIAMYQSPRLRLLLELADGAFHVLLGSLTAPFPGATAIDHAGRGGWYALFLLVESKSDRRVYSERLIQQIWRGEVDPYRFEAGLLGQWADGILPLFEPNQEQGWRVEFKRRYAG